MPNDEVSTDDDVFEIDRDILPDFIADTEEQISSAEEFFLKLSESGFEQETVNTAYRNVHSIKGNCGFVHLYELQNLCHVMETIMGGIRNKVVNVTQDNISFLLDYLDVVKSTVEDLGNGGHGKIPNLAELTKNAENTFPMMFEAEGQKPDAEPQKTPAPQTPQAQTPAPQTPQNTVKVQPEPIKKEETMPKQKPEEKKSAPATATTKTEAVKPQAKPAEAPKVAEPTFDLAAEIKKTLEAKKVEEKKNTVAKIEAKITEAEAAKAETVKEDKKEEAAKTEAAKVETTKEEPKIETPKMNGQTFDLATEIKKTLEAKKNEPAKTEPTKTETAKIETPKEDKKEETPKIEEPKTETPKAETLKETPKTNGQSFDLAAEIKKTLEIKKNEPIKEETAKIEITKEEPIKEEKTKTEMAKEEPIKTEPTKAETETKAQSKRKTAAIPVVKSGDETKKSTETETKAQSKRKTASIPAVKSDEKPTEKRKTAAIPVVKNVAAMEEEIDKIVVSDDMREGFIADSNEQLSTIEEDFLLLEQNGFDAETVNDAYRNIHSFKGNCSFMRTEDMKSVSHTMETILQAVRDRKLAVDDDLVSFLLSFLDVLRDGIRVFEQGGKVAIQNYEEYRKRAVQTFPQCFPGEAPQVQATEEVKVEEPQKVEENKAEDNKYFVDFDEAEKHKEEEQKTEETKVEEAKPIEEAKPAEEVKPAEEIKAEEPQKVEEVKPAEEAKVEEHKTEEEQAEEHKDEPIPVQEVRPAEEPKVEVPKPVEAPKPVVEVQKEKVSEKEKMFFEEVIEAKMTTPVATDTGASSVQSQLKQDVRVNLKKLENIINLAGELSIAESMVTRNPVVSALSDESLNRSIHQLRRICADLQDATMVLRMVQLSGIYKKMTRLVHDLAKHVGKKIVFVTNGEDTEVDKSVSELINDPLVHIIRNACDHGIETPQERIAAGKNETGTITLSSEHKSGAVWISVKDDGHGLDKERILQKALEQKIITPDEQLSEDDIWRLIMRPGFSTSTIISDISGRGVGMDVVQKNIEELRGQIYIKTVKGHGSEFIIRIPLTLAIIDGMIIKAVKSLYIIPTLNIKQNLRYDKSLITYSPEGEEILKFQDKLIPIVRVGNLFQSDYKEMPEDGILIVVESDDSYIALFVDEIVGQQQIVIKGLSGYVNKARGTSSCTILGDGSIALILDINTLADMALEKVTAKSKISVSKINININKEV
ncbi:MAG: Hpt domain-containing protein [Chitinivibrionia bacterium]|nr:Hpt domain-containing protein [Chitinivibrionia bacterium]